MQGDYRAPVYAQLPTALNGQLDAHQHISLG